MTERNRTSGWNLGAGREQGMRGCLNEVRSQLVMTYHLWLLTVATDHSSGRQYDGRNLEIKNNSKICFKITKVSLCNVCALREGKNGTSTYCALGTSLCEVFYNCLSNRQDWKVDGRKRIFPENLIQI